MSSVVVTPPLANAFAPTFGDEIVFIHFVSIADAQDYTKRELYRSGMGNPELDEVLGIWTPSEKLTTDGLGRRTRPRTALWLPEEEGEY